VTARPARGFFSAAAVGLLGALALPIAAWLPAGLVVLVLLAAGPRAALIAAAGAGLAIAWAFQPVIGLAAALAVAMVVLVPPYLAGSLLETSRSLGFVFQAATLAACVLVLAAHLVIGDPIGVLMPLVESVRPALEKTAEALSEMGVPRTPEEIGVATARVAWATAAWLLLQQTMLSLFAGLAAFGALREPGLFGREFRALQLGRFFGWAATAALAVGLLAQLTTGQAWQPAEDVLFVLACGFLLQALAVVHGLKQSGVIGAVPLALTYLGIVLLPMAVVGLGFADTWFRFRERFGQGAGGARG
jgi:uncharacterized protein YybS (DUF2232 family)